ncbi:MAG TPA: tetratricopeptide repeat protein, partial [Candidatus Limnocylindrales bacterium]|nr:tetratricopeptide repeat protein [Candidatus Limnocylindrales bacterium]
EARADLGVALYEQEKLDEARKQFEDVLQRDPRDATALHYVQLLRNRMHLRGPIRQPVRSRAQAVAKFSRFSLGDSSNRPATQS